MHVASDMQTMQLNMFVVWISGWNDSNTRDNSCSDAISVDPICPFRVGTAGLLLLVLLHVLLLLSTISYVHTILSVVSVTAICHTKNCQTKNRWVKIPKITALRK